MANAPTAAVLLREGIPADHIETLGFPVSPLFARERLDPAPAKYHWDGREVLYVINTGKAKAGKSVERLLEIPRLNLTITVGRDASLKAKLVDRLRDHGARVRIYGWTNQMPRLLMSHHLVIGKAGGALVQEAIAARCPIVVNQVIPGQEEGNAKLVETLGIGAVAHGARELREIVEEAFAHQGRQWLRWRKNLEKVSRPDAALRIAELILRESGEDPGAPRPLRLFEGPQRGRSCPGARTLLSANGGGAPQAAAPALARAWRVQLCDFHVHTNYSDGRLTLPEVIDFYGRRGFDCICITDHVTDPRRLLGKSCELLNFTIAADQLDEYFDMLEQERRRAWRKYDMLVMAGLEFNKEGFTKKTSGHLLGIDLKGPIAPSLDFVETIAHIHGQGGLAVAAHPHVMKSEWGKNTLFLWENQDVFAPIIDAWEIANRNNIFTPVGLKRLAYLANSDFHKPKHIYSWKTLLQCEKDPEAIKQCIRENERISLTLYRDGLAAETLRAQPPAVEAFPAEAPPPDLAVARASG